MNYKILIDNCIKKKYRNAPILNKKFILSYQYNRKKFFNKIKRENKFINVEKMDPTTQKLLVIFNYKKIDKKNKNFLIKLYKKFEFNLDLKKKYKNLKKQSNESISYQGLLLFGAIIINNNFLKNSQKFNFLLKLLDIIERKKIFLDLFYKKILISLLNEEKKLFLLFQKK